MGMNAGGRPMNAEERAQEIVTKWAADGRFGEPPSPEEYKGKWICECGREELDAACDVATALINQAPATEAQPRHPEGVTRLVAEWRASDTLAKLIYETEERLRAAEDSPLTPWVPWEAQTSRREHRIYRAIAEEIIAALDAAHRGSTADNARPGKVCAIDGET
jgi:hypothetical protein